MFCFNFDKDRISICITQINICLHFSFKILEPTSGIRKRYIVFNSEKFHELHLFDEPHLFNDLSALPHSTVLSARTRPWCLPAHHLSVNTENPTEEKRATACSTSAFPQSHRGSTSSRKVPSAPRLPAPPARRRSVSAVHAM